MRVLNHVLVVSMLAAGGCAASDPTPTTPATASNHESEVEVPAEEAPAAVRETAARELPGATRLTYVKLSGDRYEAEAIIDGRERDVHDRCVGRRRARRR